MTTTAAPSQRFATSGGKGPGAGPGGKGAKDTETDGKSAGGVRALVRSKKFILIVVLLLVAGGVAYKFLAPPTKPGPAVAGDKVKMDATTLNLAGGHYLKVAISIELVKGKASATDFDTSRAAQLTIDEFSNRTAADAARLSHRTHLLAKLQDAYPGEVFNLYVTDFLTQ